MRVISETADWESSNLISGRNSAGGFLSGIGEEDNPGFRRNQRTLFKLLRGSTSWRKGLENSFSHSLIDFLGFIFETSL